MIFRYLPTLVATVQGNIHQQRQCLQSIKKEPVKPSDIENKKQRILWLKAKLKPDKTIKYAIQEASNQNKFPQSPSPNIKTNDVMYMVVNKDEISTAYIDIIGRFPCKSSSGNEYVIVAYHYDANLVMARA